MMTTNVKALELNNIEQLDKQINNYIEERKDATSSVTLGIYKDGEVIYKKYYGYIDVENKIKADSNSVYEWGSVSKSLIWVSVLQLYENNKIDLNKDIKEYLPKEFSNKLKYKEKVTMLNLMNHQGGFQEIIYPVEYQDSKNLKDLKELLILSEPLQIYKPGQVTAYSNWSSALAAYVVENISGMPFYEYVNKNIFQVLDMNQTSVKPDWSDNKFVSENRKKSKSYAYFTDSKESLGESILYIGLYPAGSCAGTLEDYLKYTKEFTALNSKLFKKKETLDKFKEASLYYKNTKEGRGYHGLWSIDYGKKLIGHGGNTVGYSSSFWFEPESNTGIAIMTNEVGETTYNYGLLELLYGKSNKETKDGKNISGIYVNKRTIEIGLARFIKYLAGVLPINKTENNQIYKVLIVNAKIYSQGNNFYTFDNNNGLSNKMHLVNNNYLESYTSDYEKIFNVEFGLALFLVIAMALIIFSLFIAIIIMIVNKIRNKKSSKYTFINNLSLFVSAGIASLFFYLWMFIDSYEPNKVMIVSLVITFLSLLNITNLIYQIISRIKKNNTIGNLINAIWLFIPVLATIFFQLYNFWA